MKIPVPEMDERFDSGEDALAYIIRICNVILDKAKIVFPSPSISIIPGYVIEFCRKVLLQSSTLEKVAREREDYNTLCSLIRILADNVAIIRLVYGGNDDEERILRHLLYVLDGVSVRKSLLENHTLSYNGLIPIETYNALVRQVTSAKENAEGCIKYCIEAIKARPVYTTYQSQIDILLDNHNWKFKTIEKPQPKNPYQYTWKEMYGLLEIKSIDEMIPYLSQYVHGLSISNIIFEEKEDFDAPLSFSICLIGWLFDFIRRVYEPHIGEYTWDDVYKMIPEAFQR